MVTSGVAAYTLVINNMELLNIIIHIKSLTNITVISFHLPDFIAQKKYVLNVGEYTFTGSNTINIFISGGGWVVRLCWVNFQCRGVLQF